MIDIEFKDLYKQDNVPKNYKIYFPALSLTIENDRLVSESLSLEEALCSEKDLCFGECNASVIKFTVANIDEDLSGHWFTITQIINNNELPLGVYKVDSCKKQDNKIRKDIVAYDALAYTDKDVSEWYNSLFPTGNETYTLKQFRESLLAYLGIEFESEALPNDSMIVEKTVDAGQLSAREVLRCCVELQGAFGQINRYGKFTHKILAETYTDYPQEDYPQEDYPQEEPYEQIYGSMVAQNGIKFEEYTCKPIDKLIIRQEEGDVGCIYGGGTNAYIVQGNFLLYGKSSEELEAIAANIAQNIFNREYRPFTGDLIGLPYLEVGDGVKFNINDTVVSYVLQRTLTGIQALRDELKADGNEKIEQNFGLNTEIIQLKGKSAVLKRTVEQLSSTITDLNGDVTDLYNSISDNTSDIAANAQAILNEAARAQQVETLLNSKIEQTATSITQEVAATYATKTALNAEQNRAQTAETNLNSKIEQTATSIITEVSATYATKTALNTTNSAVNAEVARAQTAEAALDSKIEQTATSIRTEVSARYANKGLIPSESLAPSEDLVPADGDLVTLTEDYNSKFEQTATSISLETARAINAETQLSGRIDVMAGKVVLKVDANGNVAAVELDADPSQGTNIKIKADNIQLEGLVTANGNFKINLDGTIEAVNGKFTGNIISSYISGGSINGAEFISMSNNYEMKINYGNLTFNNYNNNNNMVINLLNIGWQIPGTLCTIIEPTKAQIPTVNCQTISAVGVSRILINSSTNVVGNLSVNDYTVIHAGNIGSQSVRHAINADYSTYSGNTDYARYLHRSGVTSDYVYVSVNRNFRPAYTLMGSCGTSDGLWTAVYAQSGTIITSDKRQKTDIEPLDERYIRFAKGLLKLVRKFKLINGQSGRTHIGWSAQDVGELMTECGISDMEFAGFIKSPVYEKKLLDEYGNETQDYDTSSEIIDYNYGLRYEEFIPLLFALLDEILKIN